MTTDGGNVKELCCAAGKPGGGDLAVVRYHLQTGMDPNFQHPEFMTTPLLEAIRGGNHEAVKMLLEHKPKTANPTIVGDWEGQTPMELALELKDHVMVDILLPFLPDSYENECKTVLVSGTLHRDVLACLLDLGHTVIVVVAGDEMPQERDLSETLRHETGNKKIWFLPPSELSGFLESSEKDSSWSPSKVDVWLHKATKLDCLIQDFVDSYPKRAAPPKILLVVESTAFGSQSTQEQLSWLLANTSSSSKFKSTVFALIEPSTWWDIMAYSFWYQNFSLYQTWCRSLARLLGLVQASVTDPHVEKDFGVQGNAYTYCRQSIELPQTDDLSGKVTQEWAKQLETVQL